MHLHFTTIIWTVAFAAKVNAALAADVKAVCSTLYSRYPTLLVWDPLGPEAISSILRAENYYSAHFDYWNAASSRNRPSCAFFPSNAEQVSFAVQTLNAHPAVRFALKSGGHNPNLGFSNVEKGVLIAFRPNSQFAYPSPDGQSVVVGAGCKWEDVYAVLEPLGKTAVGGRLGDVGVTGFILGGGLSYLSAQYGLACDNVVSFECVLANGTVVTASSSSHPELFFALRGGGNQYAIVTRMTLKTYDIGEHATIWGGVRTYAAGSQSEILSAVTNFTAGNRDPKAAIIPTFNYAAILGISIPVALVFFFYDGLMPPVGVFDNFDSIMPLTDNTRRRSYGSLTNMVLGGNLKGLRFQIRENTFPNMPAEAMHAFLSDHSMLMDKKSAKGAILDLIDVRLMSFAVQPMPRGIAQASRAHGGGGNALGLKPEHGDRVWVEYDIAWASPLCDEQCPAYFVKAVESMHELHAKNYAGIAPTHYEQGDLTFVSYNPIFMNDAMYDQDVLRSYGSENYARLRSTHEVYDQQGFFSKRQGGFKFG
ncbi:hypothetical protein RJ55_03669 [Drechmeria coniospora]|nr:hypothetical protein RJ55_03669 [Drechmeria coniospora]